MKWASLPRRGADEDYHAIALKTGEPSEMVRYTIMSVTGLAYRFKVSRHVGFETAPLLVGTTDHSKLDEAKAMAEGDFLDVVREKDNDR